VCVFCVCVCTCARTSHMQSYVLCVCMYMQAHRHHTHNFSNVNSLLNFSKDSRAAISNSELLISLIFDKLTGSPFQQFLNNFSTISSTAISCSKWRSALTFRKFYLLAAMPSSSPRTICWFRAAASWDKTSIWKEMYLHEIRRLDTETDIEGMRLLTDIERMCSFRAATIQNRS